jgi:hypothetical protein
MCRGGIAALAALVVAACAQPLARQDTFERLTAWRIAAVADVDADPTHKAAAAAILAWFQDTERGRAFARDRRPLCIGVGPASGGPFIAQPLEDLAPALMARIANARPNVRGVSECVTTMKGSPYRVEATGELGDLVACLYAGDVAPTTSSLLCGHFSPLSGEVIRYEVDLVPNEAVVRHKGIGIHF